MARRQILRRIKTHPNLSIPVFRNHHPQRQIQRRRRRCHHHRRPNLRVPKHELHHPGHRQLSTLRIPSKINLCKQNHVLRRKHLLEVIHRLIESARTRHAFNPAPAPNSQTSRAHLHSPRSKFENHSKSLVFANRPIHRKRSRPANHDSNRNRQRQQMVFVSLTLLIPIPIHERPIRKMHHRHRDTHIHRDPPRRHSRQQPDNQPKPAGETPP